MVYSSLTSQTLNHEELWYSECSATTQPYFKHYIYVHLEYIFSNSIYPGGYKKSSQQNYLVSVKFIDISMPVSANKHPEDWKQFVRFKQHFRCCIHGVMNVKNMYIMDKKVVFVYSQGRVTVMYSQIWATELIWYAQN